MGLWLAPQAVAAMPGPAMAAAMSPEAADAAADVTTVAIKKKKKKKKAGGKSLATGDDNGPGGNKTKAGGQSPAGDVAGSSLETVSNGSTSKKKKKKHKNTPDQGAQDDPPQNTPNNHTPAGGTDGQQDHDTPGGGNDQAGSDGPPKSDPPQSTPDAPTGGNGQTPPVIVADGKPPDRFLCQRSANRRCVCARIRTPLGERVLTLRCRSRGGAPAPGDDLPQSVVIAGSPSRRDLPAPPPVIATGDPAALALADFALAEAGKTPTVIAVAAATGAPSSATASAGTAPPRLSEEVLCALVASSPETTEEGLAAGLGLTVIARESMGLIGLRIVRLGIPDGRPVEDVIALLKDDPRLVIWQPNFLYRRQDSLSDADVLAGSELQYALDKVGARQAQAIATGKGVRIAIIDTGIDTSHPDLAGAVTAEFDATGSLEPIGDDHGTAIAGIIGAHGLTQGVAPGAELLSARAFAPIGGAPDEQATTFMLLRAVDWAMGQGARVLNLSFAGPRDKLFELAVAAALGKGVIIVAAAGNLGAEAPPAYPAAYRDVIAVTATDIADKLYAQANHGSYVTLAAPGVDVLTLTLGHVHDLKSGTSFAAALVSGIAALALERSPHLTAGELRELLQAASQDLGVAGVDVAFGAGLIDAEQALLALATPTEVAAP